MSLFDRVVTRKQEEKAQWIDSSCKKLFSPWQVSLIESSKTPDLIKKIIARSIKLEIINQTLIGNFGIEVIIKSRGVVRARRKFL